jgi:predicted DCC family thiol-disulfide oxidoreductase YuxK
MIDTDNKNIVVFDGLCNFCQDSVNFIIKRDPNKVFTFTSAQSQNGQDIINKFNVPEVGEDTFLLVKNNICFLRTNATLEISKDLSGFWSLFYVFKVIPRPIRDYCYDVFAKYRYTMFGKRNSCLTPTENIKDRFL